MTDTIAEAPATETAFEVGKRYRVNTINPEGAVLAVGATVQCSQINDVGTARFQEVADNDVPCGREWIIYRQHLDDLPVAPALPLVVGCRVRYCGNTVGEYQETGRIGEVGTLEDIGSDDVRVAWNSGQGTNRVFAVNVERIAEAARRPVAGDVIRWHQATGTWTDDDRVTDDDRWVVGRFDESDETFTVTKQGTGEGFFTWLSTRDTVTGWHASRCRAAWTFDDEWSTLIPATVERSEHDRIVASLQEQLAQATARADRFAQWQRNALTDAETISEVYNDEAERRNWCSEADEVTERINGRLTVLALTTRDREWNCDRTVEVTVTLRVRENGSYSGRNEPDEDDVDWNGVDNYEVHEALRNLSRGDYQFTVDEDSSEDFEAEISE